MRLRNVPQAAGAIEASPYCITDPRLLKGQWTSLFNNENPIHLEIGTGKGQFLMQLAAQNPDINYLGIERADSVIYRAVQKLESDPIPNLFFVCAWADYIEEYFDNSEISRIYLNFSDPWPKDRHAKRRLTSDGFLKMYSNILAPNGQLIFKTDNRGLFDFSVEEMQSNQHGFSLDDVCYDLHADPIRSEGNVMTEYEAKFSANGTPINRMIASLHK